ncbi:MAG: hypothetical protein GX611_08395 [Clostridiales bacterium]|nr:hypothetical protein [Clostridiales bacterium]
MKDKPIKQAIDQRLLALDMGQGNADRILSLAMGGKTVKKKTPIAALLAAALFIITLTAAAITLGWGDAGHYLKKEQQEGLFVSWPAEEQVALVQSLIKDGLIAENDTTALMSDGSRPLTERAEHARQVMTDWLAMSSDYVSFQAIMMRAWGEFYTWDVDKKAWYTATLEEAGLVSSDMERFVLPGSDDLPQAAAVRIARAWAGLYTGLGTEEMAAYDAWPEFVIFPKPQQVDGQQVYTTHQVQPEWFIHLTPPADSAQQDHILLSVNPKDGQPDLHQLVMAAQIRHYGRNWPKLAVEAEAFMKEQGYAPFMAWPLEAKAEWTSRFRADVLAQEKEVMDPFTMAYSQSAYGLPDADAIPEAEALQKARAAAMALGGMDEEAFADYDDTYVYYDMTKPEQPVWRFVFSMTGRRADDTTGGQPEQVMLYRIEIDARTGDVLLQERIPFNTLTGQGGLLKLL